MNFSGIYLIENLVNKKVYVGSAVNFRLRWNAHRSALLRNEHHSSHLQKSFKKYGVDSFKFKIVEKTEKGNLIAREQFWIDKMKSCNRKFGYNLAPRAGSTMGFKFSDESKKKLSETQKIVQNREDVKLKKSLGTKINHSNIKVKEKIIAASKERWSKASEREKQSKRRKEYCSSPEVREQFRNRALGKKASLETREKQSQSHKKRYSNMQVRIDAAIKSGSKPFEVFKSDKYIGEFISQGICAEKLSIRQGGISLCLSDKQKTAFGYTFRYV